MKFKRLATLTGKEIKQNIKSFFFPLALVVPIVFSLVVNLLFGSLFADKPKMAILDEGDSRLVAQFEALDTLTVREYTAPSELRQAVETGVADMGILLPAGFDGLVRSGELATLDVFVWGGSLIKDRAIIASAVAVLFQDLAGKTLPLEITTIVIGDEVNIPWEDRLLPIIVLISVLIGGLMIPASSLVEEKQRRTIKALTVSPATLGEVVFAKGFFGFLVSLVMGLITLAVNQAFSLEPWLLVLVMALGAIMAVAIGVIFGIFMKDLNTLFATMKSTGILIYAPAILYLFPSIPDWVAKIFPTYYIINPIVEISQRGSGWGVVAGDVYMMIGINLLLFIIIAWASKRMKMRMV